MIFVKPFFMIFVIYYKIFYNSVASFFHMFDSTLCDKDVPCVALHFLNIMASSLISKVGFVRANFCK